MTSVKKQILSLTWLLAAASMAEAATVRAYVQPETARPNQIVSYVITVQDGQLDGIPELRLPLQIGQNTAVSTSTQLQITNGVRTTSLRLTWGLAASEPGEFVIPAQALRVDGQTLTTNEVKLTVEQGGGAVGADADDPNQPILQIELSRKEIYQGEVMPVICSLYVPRQTQLRRLGLIDIEKSDFAIARFPQQSEQTITVIDGVSYVVLTFRSTLSSLRTGELKVGPATMEILVEVPMEGAQQRGNMFPPGFPQGFFGVPTEPRKITVKSQEVTLKVLPLPAEGKPANFSGAVGDFSLSATATPTDLTVGDPIAVELEVSGAGNFDALTPPALTSLDGWKSYPAKRYNIEGQLDQNQVPTLERRVGYSQVFIPEAVHSSLPPFETSFFSPTKKQYVTLRTEAIPLTMKPAPAPAQTEAASGAVSQPVEAPPLVTPPQPDITDIVINPPSASKWLSPTGVLLVKSSAFWTVQAVPVGLVFLASVLAVLRRRKEARLAGRAGELRAAWNAFEPTTSSDTEFLRGAAQFIHTAQNGTPVKDADLQAILNRYQTANFSGVSSAPLSTEERSRMLAALGDLFRRALSKVSVLLFLGALVSGALQAQTPTTTSPDAVYQEAVAEMAKGNFTRAQYLAESLTKKNPPHLSSEVLQMIGHARYRQEDLGRAVLWYQRAQLLDPWSPELRQNLFHLDERLRFLTFGYDSPLTEWSLWLKPNQWIILAASGFWLVLLSIAWRIWAGRRSLGWAVAVSMVGFTLAVPATALAAVRPLGAERVRDISLVIMPDVRAFTAATVTAGTVMDLPPGSEVRILERRGAWCYVEIPAQPQTLRGWVEAGTITPLWIWDENLVP
ncbi:Oxygen tolerance [Prosthecobacter debontii]|uniref:Oxygen tolerance n=1 Tax=Prosthecobacter debontii TaxID=48467 RepID=A0A1T4Y8Z3_9BACT|nr:Oxygen tolerance [Prosthecobacter debontii]